MAISLLGLGRILLYSGSINFLEYRLVCKKSGFGKKNNYMTGDATPPAPAVTHTLGADALTETGGVVCSKNVLIK
jgi:hypothetical protein